MSALMLLFLDNRLTGQFDFFRRQRDGLPASRYDVLLPSEVGFSLPKENLNSDVHMGYDAAVRWTDRVEDFTYSIGGNITYSRFYDWEQYKPRFLQFLGCVSQFVEPSFSVI